MSGWRNSGFGIGPISHLEIECWARLMQIELYPSEVVVLRTLDTELRMYHANKDKPDQPVSVIESLRQVAEKNAAKKSDAKAKADKQKAAEKKRHEEAKSKVKH